MGSKKPPDKYRTIDEIMAYKLKPYPSDPK